MELSNAIAGTLNLRLPGTLVFDYPSVRSLSTHVHGLLQQHVPVGMQQTITASQLAVSPKEVESTRLFVQV